MKQQRRGQKIAMTSDEIDDFLAGQRTCRVATIGPDGRPRVVPLWFVWEGGHLWLNSLTKSQRWSDLMRNSSLAVVVDDGEAFHELRGVEISGFVDVVGDVPRTQAPVAELVSPETLFARKYAKSDNFVPDGRHAWLRVTPEKMTSWDFRKNPALVPGGSS